MSNKDEYLYQFQAVRYPGDWEIVNDEVMGGHSEAELRLDSSGYGLFTGRVSLKDGGGFSSVRCKLGPKKVEGFSHFVLRIKGGGKSFQFRIKPDRDLDHSYMASFRATEDWRVLEIPFEEMHPVYRGKALKIPNYSGEQLDEIAFLIANGQEEEFRLGIDYIKVKAN